MKTPNTVRTTLWVCICLTSQSGYGNTLTLAPSSIPALQHFSGDNGAAHDTQGLNFPNLAVHLLNYDTIQMTVQAPAGQAWFVDTDPSFTTHSLAIRLDYNQLFVSPYAAIDSASLNFNLVQGDSSAYQLLSHAEVIPTTGDRFYLYDNLNINQDMAFTGFTLTVQYNNASLADAALTGFFSSDFTFQYAVPVPSVLSQHMTLAPIPEPSVAAFGLSAACLLLLSRRRKLQFFKPDEDKTRPDAN